MTVSFAHPDDKKKTPIFESSSIPRERQHLSVFPLPMTHNGKLVEQSAVIVAIEGALF